MGTIGTIIALVIIPVFYGITVIKRIVFKRKNSKLIVGIDKDTTPMLPTKNKALEIAKKQLQDYNITIAKEGMDDIEGPMYIIASYNSELDKYIIPLVLKDYNAKYIISLDELEESRKTIWKDLGTILNNTLSLKPTISEGHSIVLFQGKIASPAGNNLLGDLPAGSNYNHLYFWTINDARYSRLPIVTLNIHGSYLSNPIWSDHVQGDIPIRADLRCIYKPTPDDTTYDDTLDDTYYDLYNKLIKEFSYSDYDYQLENNIKISYPKRAEGIHKVLYQCINCGTKYKMTSHDSTIKCTECNSEWTMDELGRLNAKDIMTTFNATEWYKWECQECAKEVNKILKTKRGYKIKRTFHVHVKALINSHGLVDIGYGELTLNKEEYELTFSNTTFEQQVYDDNFKKINYLNITKNDMREIDPTTAKHVHFPHNINPISTVQIRLSNDKNDSKGIILRDEKCLYYLYCEADDFVPAELQIMTELFCR